ncbi:putative plasma membrane ferric-chelate reductase [Talaromyces proteolyticus]|uniref:Plasma membrane ferric-chelate reductase n=1 Tax=Talaromyces proteolyticus TaxID=1131652 RepID=A0AAD4PXR7_9EURO|nr:putative plasma membrane ferric-chelate reductase [Talaromyces proteolyticus]KAH8693940.1 putative plasma membrane ferric-chelate reductase [Talaromyces proteolyticus]
MQLCLLFGISAVLLSHYVRAASVISENERCVTAVYTGLDYVSFAGEPAYGLWENRCQNPLKVASIYAAAEKYCGETEQTAGFAKLDIFCLDLAYMKFLPRENVAENLTKESVEMMRVVRFQEVSRSERINYPVLLSPAYFDRTFRTIDTWQIETWAHQAYGYFGYLYWASVLLVGMMHRLLQHSHRVQSTFARLSSFAFGKMICRAYQWVHTYLIIAFPLKSPSRKVLCFDLPTRIDTIIILGFWLLTILLTSITYPLSTDNIYWPNPTRQLLRYVADRTGIMAFANLPLLWIFAGRNNIFLWATGWSFATFNLFHRHVAWIATAQAVVHTLAYLILFDQTSSNKLRKQVSKTYIIWGATATVAMVMVLPSAIKWIRNKSYEFFLLVHIVLSVVTIVGCFYHIIIFEDEGYEYYLWPVVAIWCSDRILRLIRMIYCNFYAHCRRAKLKCTSSTALYDKTSNVIRLEVIPGSSSFQPTASSYYYLYQPFRFRGWENHPFTLGSWKYIDNGELESRNKQQALNPDESTDGSQIPLLSSSDHEHESPLSKQSEITVQQPNLIFWIRPYDGWTRSLRDQCLKSMDRTIHPTILLEGPYGEPFPIDNYDSVLLIAGGTGIACAVPYIKQHNHHSVMSDYDKTETPRRDIRLVWAARESSFIIDVATRELQNELISCEEFSASFYSTSAGLRNQRFKIPSNHNLGTADIDLDIQAGRPNLRELVLEHAREASDTQRSAVVLVSGPTTMADEARAAVQHAIRRGYRRIAFKEESFSW